ncbi:MAG: hypothetical protein ACR2OH_06005 [Microthrixaceae bacterium]
MAPVSPGSPGLIDEAVHQAAVDDYLGFATQTLQPGNPTNVVAHLIRAERDPGFSWDPTQVDNTALANLWTKLDDWKDTGDFDLMYLLWMRHLGQGIIDPSVLAALDQRLAEFRYRWNDPLPADRLDHKWFWSENHRVILAVDEYLAGMALPTQVFNVTGLTGAQHAERARPAILEWIQERARFGFSEWHSNVYMLKNITPLVTIVELSDDEELIRLGTAAIDLCMADLAMHLQNGAYGATRGRTYKKDKMNALDEDTFGTTKFLFGDTTQGWTTTSDTGVTYLCGAQRYRVPEVVRQIATSSEVTTSRERHGVPLNPHEPISPLVPPEPAYGIDYDDPENLPFWWSQGALTAWQLVPITLSAAAQYRLWETDLFAEYDAIREIASGGTAVAQVAARELASMAAFGLLSEANTYTWRSPDVMLSSVVEHRPGDARDQVHVWQATIDHEALVFTTHPQKPTPQSLDWGKDSGYWTGSASMPSTVQHENVAVHVYQPAYASPTDELLGPTFGYEMETHAYFPQDRFDEVVQANGWTIGRRGDGYIALWSDRPTQWRVHDPAVVATDGMVQPFDLVAPGGADNVWIVEVGNRADHGEFANFVTAITTAEVEVARPVGNKALARYVSPSQGEISYSRPQGLVVGGAAVPVGKHQRLESPWGEVCHLGKFLALEEGGHSLTIDFEKGVREVT